MSGLNAGKLESVVFSDVEHLIGGDDNEDEFIFGATGGVTGSVEGGARGFDTVVLDGGTFESVVYTAKNANDGTIARDADLIVYTGFEPITDNTNTANRVIEASAIADTIKISRVAPGKIKVESDNDVSTFESIEFNDPSSSLTIKSAGYIAGPVGADTVTIESLGLFNADLIIETGTLNAMEDGEDSITFAGDIDLNGKKLQATAENITVNTGVTLKTSNTAGVAGAITLDSWHTTISTSAKLLAEGKAADGSQHGDITINAINNNDILTPLVNIEIKDVGIDIQTGAQLKGGDVKLIAKAEAGSLFGDDKFGISDPSTWGAKLGDTVLSKLEGLSQVVAAVSVSTSEATIDVASGASIEAKGDFEARATAGVAPKAAPKFTGAVAGKVGVPLPALAIAVGVTDASVNIGGKIDVTGNATIAAKGDHTLDAASDASETKRVAPAGALTVLDSDIKAHVNDDATLNVGGNLIVEAFTIDRNRTSATSNAGEKGDIAIAVAVSIENGETKAFLDGATTVGGSVTVNAKQQKESIESSTLLIIPTLNNGTFAGAGVGSDKGGDLISDLEAAAMKPLMDGAKDGLIKFGGWVKEKFTGKASKDQQKDDTVTKDNAFSFDAAAAIAVAVDSNVTLARIGDGNEDLDGKNGVVTASGPVTVQSSVAARPDITAASNILSDTKASGGDETKFAGSLAVAVGVYTNNAYAQISEQAQVTSGKNVAVDAQALNQIDPLSLWGVNLVSPFLKKADFDTTQGTKTIGNGKVVEIKEGHNAGGDSGTWYQYIGATDQALDLSKEDFTNESEWKSLGNPIKHILVDNWVPNVAGYLNENLGLDANLADSFTQATATGDAKTAIAGAVTVIDLDQTAEAKIKAGAKVNDGVTSNNERNVSVTASSVSQLVNLSGNVQLPGLKTSGDIKSFKVDFQKPGFGADAGKDGNAAGATVMVFDLDNTVAAVIEDGAKITGDSLQVTADTFAVNASLGASGGESDNFGLNGAFIVTLVDNSTLAHIDNGATLAIGAKAVADADGKDASLFLGAQDKTYVVNLAGGVAASQHIGVGLSAGVTVVNRDTEAVIGNRHDKSAADTRGSLTSLGDVRLNASNEGFVGSVVVAGSKASQKSQDPTAKSGDTGMKGSDGKSTDDPGKLPNNQKSYDSVIAELKAKLGESKAPASDESVGKQQGKAGIAVSGAAAVSVVDDNARAYIHELGAITATNKAITLAAGNNTHVGSLAGGVAFAGDPTSTKNDVAIAGGFGGVILSGTTAAFLDDVTSVSSKTLTIEADRSGWVVSLTAGVSGASGRSGIAVAGSVGVTLTDYTTEASLSSTTGTIAGALTIDAADDTNLITIAGSAGFGGKAGIGAAVAFTQIENTTRATIQSVTDLKHTGALTVSATAGGLIVAVTGSVGVGSGENSKLGLAGTVTVNRIANVVEARVLNSTFHKDSTGDIRIDASDNSFIFSFAGAFGASKSAGLGVAAAVNLLDNTVRAQVSGSTLQSTGKLDVEADQTGTLVSVALGVGSGKQFALAGSIAVNVLDNTIEAEIINGSDVKVGGAIDISADDRSVGVAIAGGAAFGKTAAVGAAFAGNFEKNTLKARVDDSVVESTNSSAALGAEARATLVSVAIGGAGGDTFALGGSISINQVENTIEAAVTDANGVTGKSSLLKAKNDISVAAADDTTMVIVAGGLAFAKTAAIGVSASTAEVKNKVHAYVSASKLESTSGKISVTAGFGPPDADADMKAISLGTSGIEMPEAAGSQIVNIAVGVAGGGTFAGGGAFSLNWIRNDVQVYAVNGANVSAGGDITFAAFDDPEIDSFAVGGGVSTGTAGVGVGFSYNYIGGDPGNPSRNIPGDAKSANVGKALANVNASTVTSTGGTVSILAGTTPKIINATIAGGGGGTVGASGSVSINFIRSLVDASVTGGSSISANNHVKVGASATPIMITVAGNVSIGGTAGLGAAVATNDMQSKITARIDGSKAKATTGDIIVDASIGKAAVLPSLDTDVPVDAQIWSFAVSGAGAGTAAIAGSASLNWIRNVVEASISNVGNIDIAADEISAAGKVSVTASDASTLNALAGGFAVQIGSPGVAAGASVAYNYLGGDPNNPGTTDNNRVSAKIENITGQLKAGSIEVKSSYTGSINNLTIGGAGASGFALGGAVSINNIRNTAEAGITGSSGISTTSGNVTVEAKDTSTIRALAGGVGVAIAPGGGAAAALGAAVGVNEIRNTTKAYIDNSSVTSAAGISLTADAKQKIEVLTVGGAVSVAAGDGVAFAGAGAGSGNTVDNDVLAYITNSGGSKEIKANNGSIALTAKDESTIRAASGGVAVSVAVGSTGAVGASIGVSASDNDITNTIKAYIDGSKVTATKGNVDLQATENATIEALSIAGSASVGGGLIGGGAFAGAGAGAGNTIANTVQAYISNSSTVSTITSGMVKLSASDTSKIKIDSGGVAAAVAGGAAALGVAAGASVAINDIKNTIQAYVADSTITSAGAVQISATSTPTIDALSISGAVAATGGGGGISAAGSGSSSENVIANKVEAFALKSTVTSQNSGAVSISATETGTITARSVGAAAAIAVGAVGGTMAVGVGLADNEIKSTIKAYSDQSTITSAGALDIKASSSSTTESLSVAVALSVSAAPAGVAFAGGGANSTSLVENTVQAYAVGTAAKKSDLTAARRVTISATETSKMTADVAAASMSIGVIGASVGVSIANNKANSDVKAYVDNVNLTSTGTTTDKGVLLDGIVISASADDTISKTLSVATSIALSIGGAGAGAEATATGSSKAETYVGSGATVKSAQNVDLSAQSKGSLDAQTFGLAAGLAAIGGSVAKASFGGTVKAHVDGTIAQSTNVTVTADATQSAKARATALAGGIIAGSGADATATVNPTVQVYGTGNITASNAIAFAATATPKTEASALGIAVGVGAVGVSDATAKAAPQLTANPGGASTVYNAKSFSVSTAINVPVSSYTAKANSTGATGGLIGVNATSVSATTEGKAHSTIADGSTLVVSDAVSITATGDSKQRAEADSFNVGLVAVGGNVSVAYAKVDTQAYLGKEVTISNGTDIGGLVDGERYYVVLDDIRTFGAGAVSTGGETIDLGTDHGLKTGDRVVYKAGSAKIDGLTSLETYSVELVGGTAVRLRTISDDGVIGGVVDLQSAQGGTLQLADPRRVRLATTSEKAFKLTPDVNLDTSKTSGTKHQLTPVTGFAAGALEFNPATQANSSKETIELQSGHGLLTGAAVTYGRSGGAVLTISATGTDYVHAISESGSGGVVAGAVATASTVVDSKTRAFIADDSDGDLSKTLLRVSKLNINATHTSQYDSELSSIQASLVGYSGGWANNNIKATVEATIGDGADIVTQDLQVVATNKTRKDIVAGANVKAGSGGAFVGNNAESLSNLENRTSATIGDHASVRVTGSLLAPGNFLLSAYNDNTGDDEVLLDTGGALVISGVESKIKVNVNDATASIGAFSKIETVGAIDMQTRSRGEFSVHPQAHTYGLAGGVGVDALVHINNDNLVSIGADTTVQALGDVNMLAGKDRDGARNFFKIRSHGDDLNATAVPITDLKSHVQLEQDNDVFIGERAVVRTARDANLIGEQLSTADIVAFGTGKNWLTAIAGGIDSLFGAGGSEEEKGGTTTHPQSQTVTVHGTVEVGILKDQKLTISKGTGKSETELTAITENVGNIKTTTTIESLATNLSVERQRLLKLISDYAGDLESVAAYTAMLAQVEQQMDELGLIVETDAVIIVDGKPVTTKVKSVQEGFNVPYITVDPIWAQSGTIRISGGSVLGSGELKAPGNVNVTITNHSPAFLRLKGITIPDNDGGTVRLNGIAVTDIAGFGGKITSSADGGKPVINVINTFEEGDIFGGNNVDPWNRFRTPDLEIAGEISNLKGDVTLVSQGSVLARSNILAGKLTITAGKDFVLTSTDALFHAGGSPASATGPWRDVQRETETKGAAGGTNYKGSVTGGTNNGVKVNDGVSITDLVSQALNRATESNIVAANNIVIVAQTLNVNGILRSGIDDHKATIDSSFASKIAAAEAARSLFLNGFTALAHATATGAQITADEGYTFFKLTGPQLKTDASGLEYTINVDSNNNVPVYYNAQADRLEVSGVRVQGGFMSLTGRILNTNPNARIEVMDGYGQITIKNDLDIPLVINRLDTGNPGDKGQGIEGKLIITDSGQKNGAGAPRVTEYTRVGSDIQKKEYFFVTPGDPLGTVTNSTVTGSRVTSYTPKSDDYRFYWTTGQDSTKKTYTTYGTSAWLNIDAFAPDPDDITDGPHVEYATPRALATGSYIGADASNPDYTYEFERIMQGSPQTKVEGRWETSTWYGETTYYTKTLTWQGQKDIHTHSIRADRPVTIEFIGYDEGAVTVTTQGGLQINGEIQNATGTTTLKATTGSITQVNDSVAVGGRSISLTAGDSIGGDAVIQSNLTDGGGGSLSAVAGDVVRISERTGDLVVNQVTVNATTGDRVELTAGDGSILGVAGNYVRGGLVVLESAGSIGTFGTGGSARTLGAGARAINVDTGATDRDTFTARALGDIYVRETAGDLRIVSVDTSDASKNVVGGVRLEVTAGRMVDANTIEVKDSRTETALMGVWERMNATESTAYISIEATVRSFENLRTREYDAYWDYRQSQADGGKKYDDKFAFTMSADERAIFEAYYATQGFTDVEIDEAIDTLENGRTKEYHELHKTYGRFGDTFDDTYRYGTAPTQSFGSSAVSGSTVTLKGHSFDTGDAVVYLGGGGTVGNLVEGKTYYVVVDSSAPGAFKLAATREDALKAAPATISLGAVTGSSNVFAAADLTFGNAAVDAGKDTITLARHTFQTGQKVVFQSQGGTIGNLADETAYYVVVDAADTSKIRLAANHADATATTPVFIDLGAVSGGGFILSEADALAYRAAWSESLLKNSFSAKILGPKDTSGTTATTEEANIIGTDVVLDVSSHVGATEAMVEIKLPVGELSDKQKLALAAAERSDVKFYADDAGTIEIDDPRTSKVDVRLIHIVPKADVDVTVKGSLTLLSGGSVNLGSEESIAIDKVNATDAARIKVQKGLTDAKISAVNVSTGDLILEAEEGGIGSSTDRLVLDLHSGATLVARAQQDIYLTENAGDMKVVEITSTDGNVDLVADGSIFDADTDDAGTADANILANNVTLKATKGSIGTATDYLEIDVETGGLLNAQGQTGVHLHEVTGDMLVDLVKANGGDVRLRAAASILEVNDLATDVFGRSIMLTADFGSIGAPLADLEIDSSFGSTGSVTTTSSNNVHLVEAIGDLRLNTVSVDSGTAFIKAVNGSILNAHADESSSNVLSGNVWLFASQNIGAPGLRLTTESGKLEGQSTSGSTYILNTGALQVGGVTGSESGISSGGKVSLTSKSPITVAKHISAVSDIEIISFDDGGDDDVVIVEAGYTVTTTAGAITVQAGDGITIETGAKLTAKGDITMTSADDSGTADDVLIATDAIVNSQAGAIAITAGDKFTIEKGAQLTALNSVTVTTTDDAVSGLSGDSIIVKNGATIASAASSVTLQAGDDVVVEKGAFVDADTSIVLRSDFKSADVNGSSITIEGKLQAPSMQLHGGEQADTIVLRPESLIGDTQVFGHGGDDKITLDRLPSIQTTQMILGKAVRDTVDLDGGEGADSYTINITGNSTDYLVNITDTGVAGNDVVTINATADNDLFLVRENFVAYLNTVDPLTAGQHPGALHNELERFNYNANIENLNINSLAGDDQFYVDDNSSKTTLSGGEGKDFFQFGQLFSSERVAPNVAPGDEISALRTTVGWLSRGVSHETVAMGDGGDDTFQVYSNQAELALQGNDGDDTFIVRSFALADENGDALIDQSMSKLANAMGGEGNDVVQYNVNANLAIDGGTGDDRFILLGSELSDDFVITGETVYGGGQSITYQNVERVTVDGLQGNDNFFILGTKAGVVTTVAGGAGWDTFHLGGDITRPIVSKAFQDLLSKGLAPAGDHFATGAIAGPLFIEGGFGPDDFSLRQAVILPTETDGPLSQLVNPPDDDGSVDTLYIFNDGSTANEVATLTHDNFRTAGMAGDLTLPSGKIVRGGVNYTHVETLEIMLGTGNDALTIESTMEAGVDGDRGPLTIVHGGGGSDTITVTGGGGANSPLVIFGDTESDGSRYSGVPTSDLIKSGQAWQFNNAGDDYIDASQAGGAVTIFGGRGNDTIIGSAFGDQLAGGSGDDTIVAGGGNDLVYGDSGFTLGQGDATFPEPNNKGGTATRTIYERRVVVVDAPDADAASYADTLFAGDDEIDGGNGNDIIVGDLGIVTQALFESLYDTTKVVSVTTSSVASGGSDTITAADGDDIVLGGSGADEIHAGVGSNIVIGDNGFVQRQSPDGLRGVIASTDFAFGGDDVITALDGDDIVLGGNGADEIDGGNGNNVVFGDDGEIVYAADGRMSRIVSTSTTDHGGADSIHTGSGDDVVIGGRSDDDVQAGAGNNLVIGDSGRILANAASTTELWNGIPLPIGTIETFEFGDGGIDVLTALDGNNIILGGAAGDVLIAGNGNNLIAGDDAQIVYATDGRLSTIMSTSTDEFGGEDWIQSGSGDDIVIGGRLGDTIHAGAGNNVVFGDSGQLLANAASTTERWAGHPLPTGTFESITHGDGGNDQITTLGGNDIVVGGHADDVIDAGDGDNLVFGDDGQIVYATDGRLSTITSTSTDDNGGVDTITTGANEDIILGGRFGDTINGGAGDNVVFGDSGQLLANALSTTERWAGHPLPTGTFESITHDDGGNDQITTLGGNDIVLGGHADDAIDAGDGDNLVFGDDGQIVYATDGRLSTITSTSTDDNGGVDDITTGAGQDIVLGGRFGDTIHAGAGNNVVFGDSGQLLANALSTTERWAGHPLPTGTFESITHDDGGNDQITTLGGYDIVVGGHASDTIDAGDGDNLVFGDDGQIVYATDGRLSTITSTSTAANGGADNITTGTGQDILIGGRFGDIIHAGAGNNVVFGDSGQLVADPSSIVYPWASHPLPIGLIDTIEPGDGGADTITTLGGSDLVLGGDAGDVIDSGAGDDIVIAEHATVEYADGIAVTITTTDTAIGGDDTIHAGADDDVVIGGTGHDAIDGGSGRDLLLGDSATLDRSATLGDFRNPRFRALTGTAIYSVAQNTAGQLLIDTNAYFADPRGPAEWADFQITLQHHDDSTPATLYGDDYIAGGADDDTIFGQLGNDVIQGDGSIDFVSGGGRVGASRDAAGDLHIRASFEAATDGHDYIEGGGGADVVFGNLGQDDIIGGSSSLFSANTPDRRPDGADLIFGGAGTHAGRNDAGNLTAEGHANDADTIVGDNGNIYRLVNAAPSGNGLTTFRTFNYDTYSTIERIVPRGVTLLDYTAGGPDLVNQAGPLVAGDIGAADEIHGEAGDDIAYGGAGNDVLFGDAQDDDLIGGYGHDWISGGDGEDGILGDDGRIFTSRNGTAEPLSGVNTASTQTLLEGNGPGTINATVHVTGTLHKHVDLTPFELDPNRANLNPLYDPRFADDIIFGGLGRDFIHGGAGDDAVSGAEALNEAYFVRNGALVRSDFARPTNPGDVLDYNETTTLFAQHDANNPVRRILLNPNGTLSTNNTGAEFFLNFDPTEGPLAAGSTTVRTDGDDIIFGDMGNDWLVGGTGRDHVFGGWGDDVINLDDDHRTNRGLNNTPDAEASYADFAYGGAGRDVLIANATGDVMVDSTGEFNSFIVPFSKFGPTTVNRAINPQMEEFLYSLGAADGADQTLATTTSGTGSTARRGEPYGELGLVTQQDPAAGDNRGGPRDPQPGNNGGPSSSTTTSTATTTTITSAPATSTSLTVETTTAPATEPATQTSATTASTSTATPSIDWSGTTSDVTLLPWAQGTQSKPVGLSVPTFDIDDDDDDLIDWTATPTTAPAVTSPQTTTTTLSATSTKNGNGHTKK